MGQRLDIRLSIPPEGGTFPVLGRREGGPQRTGIMLATQGAAVRRLSVSDDKNGPMIGLDMEATLRPMSPLVDRPVTSHFKISLIGDMAKYKWGIAGDHPRVRARDRLEIAIKNTTMMSHPMHLHGHHFQVVGINGKRINGAVRDTVLMPSMATVEIAVDALNPGRWPLHCHHLYHMATGMMTYLNYGA
jgi:FtsP/CotA-like multicopper oxidase with cupredoxin domain